MTIEPGNGTIRFAGGEITPGISTGMFLGSPLGAMSEKWFANGAFETYRFTPESGITATADFQKDRLLNVAILFDVQDYPADGPSTKCELLRKGKHDEWLRAELGEAPYEYHWGKVESVFYHQHCESNIAVTYGS